MAITQAFSGSASSWATEFSLTANSTVLASQASPGVYQLFVDMTALGATDTYTIRVYDKVRADSAARRVILEHVVVGVQSSVWAFPSLVLMHGWDMSIVGTGTTTRTIEWSIRKVA